MAPSSKSWALVLEGWDLYVAWGLQEPCSLRGSLWTPGCSLPGPFGAHPKRFAASRTYLESMLRSGVWNCAFPSASRKKYCVAQSLPT
eukprot:6476276-Pyramimonas_sp.AAC.1